MKVIKVIVIAILVIIAVPLLIALFIPKKYTVTVTESINKPKEVVMDYVKILKNQEEYSEWVKADLNNHPEIVGTDGTVGATSKWNSENKNVGEGSQKIITLTPDSMVVDLHFIRPFEGHAKAANIVKSVSDNQSQITSVFYAEAPYPFNLMSYLFGRKMIEDTQQKNLKNIKDILEKK